MIVLPIKSFEVEPWLLEKHYAKRLPHIMYAFGLYERDELIGVITYGLPASYTLCQGICGEKWSANVLELNRLCLLHNKKNQASYLVAHSLSLLPRPSIVVSYADTGMGHVGYVYQATNFLFTGTSKERTDPFSDGQHHRHKTDTDKRQIRTAKHRYVYIVANRIDKKKILKDLNYEVMEYPKGVSKRYDSGGSVATQRMLF